MRHVRTERHDAVAHVILDRPEHDNALTPEMWEQVGRIGEELLADRHVKCVVVRGEGSSFCAGTDRTAYQQRDIAAEQDAARWLIDGEFVSIAAVRGAAIGAGAELAIACDMRIVGDDAQFALPDVTIGLLPDISAVAVLPGIVGYGRALELVLTGHPVDAARAAAIGLATQLVPAASTQAVAEELAVTIAGAPAEAIRYCKRAMRHGAAGELDRALELAREGGALLLAEMAESLRSDSGTGINPAT
ncbi:MAG: enoyl-CoA hydratase/isomerase family protein [Solirubrobacteraceae bacterium]